MHTIYFSVFNFILLFYFLRKIYILSCLPRAVILTARQNMLVILKINAISTKKRLPQDPMTNKISITNNNSCYTRNLVIKLSIPRSKYPPLYYPPLSKLNHKNYYFFNHRSFWPHTVGIGIHEVSVALVLKG